MSDKQFVFFFGDGKAEGDVKQKALLGGKGANLAEMTKIGLPVPPGFTITTEVCHYYDTNGQKLPAGCQEQIEAAIGKLEKSMGKKFGDAEDPLLVSVRSGAAVSMPGMMDTILNLGLNDKAVEGLVAKTGNERFAVDSYRRLINMFGDTVMGIPHEEFENELKALKKKAKVEQDTDLNVAQLRELIAAYKKVYKKGTGSEFPQDAREQLNHAIGAVFGSWSKPNAVNYRSINKIDGLLGTAVNVQTMVFGNMGETSGTGVCMTRDNTTGENVFSGEFLMNAQGEDVVAGIRTPRPVIELKDILPDAYHQLLDIKKILENHFKDMQDIEFTIQEKRLYMLQTRSGKRSAVAAARIAVELCNEGLIDKKAAVLRMPAADVNQLLRPVFDNKAKAAAQKEGRILAKGLNAGPGAASGRISFTAEDAEARAAKGEKVILVREFTSPDDVRGMYAAQGILTSTGGMTSHAAIVACGSGIPCVVGCHDAKIDAAKKTLTFGRKTLKEKDVISIDGRTGEVILGEIPTGSPGEEELKDFGLLMKWADEFRTIKIRTNVDKPEEAVIARNYGAEGIGLCRIEHMFYNKTVAEKAAEEAAKSGKKVKAPKNGFVPRIHYVQQMIVAAGPYKKLKAEVAELEAAVKGHGDHAKEAKAKLKEVKAELKEAAERYQTALDALEPELRADFEGLMGTMNGFPVTIRLVDPPLHEFLPKEDETKKVSELAKSLGVSSKDVVARIKELHEENPMLGFRGCRLGIVFPEITDMQVRAIIEATCNLAAKGVKVLPEIMVPLVGAVTELADTKKRIQEVAGKVFAEKQTKVDYLIGTMIEVPRAAVTADEIAKEAEFFSFGTNDLTQTTYGISRDDVNTFLPTYQELKIWKNDPFAVLDQGGVGQLIKTGIEKGRSVRNKLKVGICGEHGGEPTSVEFCVKVGMDYVSCSPFRVPTARLAAAQGAIKAADGK